MTNAEIRAALAEGVLDKNGLIEVFKIVRQAIDAGDIATANELKALIASAVTPKGSVNFDSLPVPAADKLGHMYNVKDSFTVTSSFVEFDDTPGATQATYPAGTNVAVVEVTTTVNEEEVKSYKWDVMAGFVDTSGFVQVSEIEILSAADIQACWTASAEDDEEEEETPSAGE